MSYEFCEKLPKVELHAHLNGSLSVSTIGKLVRLHKQSFPDEDVPPAADIFKDPSNFDDGYAIFKCAQALVDHPEAVKLAAKNVLKEFAEDNVIYVELRSTPRNVEGKMTKVEYVQAIIDAIQEEKDTKASLLVSIDRRKSLAEAKENLNVAKDFHEKYPEIVVGIDLSGDARVNDLQDYYQFLEEAQKNGLKVSLHFGEENNETEIKFVLDHPKFKPERLGHCTYAFPNFAEKFEAFGIPSELCLTSNVKCGSVTSYGDHHVKEMFQKGLPFCICTDDKGVFSCSSTDEHLKAMEILKLNQDQMFDLSFKSINYIFANECKKDELRSKMIELKLNFQKI